MYSVQEYLIRVCTHDDHVQVYLVAGGISSDGDYRYDTTELLVHGASAWTKAGRLPLPMGGMQAVSLDNQIISTGDFI